MNKPVLSKVLLASSVLLLASLIVACGQPALSLPLPAPAAEPPPTTATTGSQPPEQLPPDDKVTDEEQWSMVETFTGNGNEITPSFHVSGTKWRISWMIDTEYPDSADLNLVIYPKDTPYEIWQTISYSSGDDGNVTYFIYPKGDRDFFIKVLARNLRRWTITVEDTAAAVSLSHVQITHIHYRGTVYQRDPEECVCRESIEPDEYVVIKNSSDCYQEIGGWVLKNITKGYISFTFPPDVVLAPGGIIRVYTSFPFSSTDSVEVNEYALYPFCFYYGPGDIWDDEEPNVAVLYNAGGKEISRRSYTVTSHTVKSHAGSNEECGCAR